jgi:D(-)-tartrate dehydratase
MRIVDVRERSVAISRYRDATIPSGGHLFTVHVACGLGLGGAEMNPLAFGPFGGLADGTDPVKGRVAAPEAPDIGFEGKAELARLFHTLLDD